MSAVRRIVLFSCLVSAGAVPILDGQGKNYAISVAKLGELFNYDEELVDMLESFADELEERVLVLNNYVEQMRERLDQAEVEGQEKYLSNPVNAVNLMRHMHADWHYWVLYLEQQESALAHAAKISAMQVQLPSARDLREANVAIQRLQETYNLTGSDIAVGLLQGKQYNASLTPLDCYAMAQYYLKQKSYELAAPWLKATLKLYLSNSTQWDLYKELGLPITEVSALLADVQLRLEQPEVAIKIIEAGLDKWPNDSALVIAYNKLLRKLRILPKPPPTADNKSQFPVKPLPEKKSPALTVLQRCCSTECRRDARLFCLYDTHASPFLRLAPFKMEMLSQDPYVVLYYDVLYAQEMSELRQLAQPSLERAVTYNESLDIHSEDTARTTKGYWLESNSNNLTERIDQRIKDMTNFNLAESEPFQIMNYGIGGHYEKHFDFFNSTDVVSGDRLVTMLFYLSGVEQGGATIFTELELSIYPVPGAVLMWYNLNPCNGTGDRRTKHAACPTLVGSRWVMTRWIDEYGEKIGEHCLLKGGRSTIGAGSPKT